MNHENERRSTNLLKLLNLALLMFMIYFGVNYFIPLLFDVSGKLINGFMPFIIALIIAILIDPIVDWLVIRKRVKRGYAVAFTITVLLVIIVLLVVLALSRLVIELATLCCRRTKVA